MIQNCTLDMSDFIVPIGAADFFHAPRLHWSELFTPQSTRIALNPLLPTSGSTGLIQSRISPQGCCFCTQGFLPFFIAT